MTKAADVLRRALSLITGDRATEHGPVWENHTNIAHLWNGYLNDKADPLDASDVANMMELLKIARRKSGKINVDDYVDGAGYAAAAYECASRDSGQGELFSCGLFEDYESDRETPAARSHAMEERR
jgi:hypothetical protein